MFSIPQEARLIIWIGFDWLQFIYVWIWNDYFIVLLMISKGGTTYFQVKKVYTYVYISGYV